jgi:hypothetical protein
LMEELPELITKIFIIFLFFGLWLQVSGVQCSIPPPA